MNYSEYTTVTSVKEFDDTDNITDDALLLSMIKQTSKEMEDITNRWFNPRIQTRYYDTPPMNERRVYFDTDCLEVLTLTNGDGTVITDSNYYLYPLNSTVKQNIYLAEGQYVWLNASNGFPQSAITVKGIWGYHDDYESAWIDTGLTVSGSITASATSIATSASGILIAGDFIGLDDEYLYVSAVSGSTITVARGINGSTAAVHSASTINRWNPGSEIINLCNMATVAYYMLRQNPTADTTTVDGMTFKTPKDIKKWLEKQLHTLALTKLGIA